MMNLLERFWKHVNVKKDYECWMWNGKRNPDGYGQIYIKKVNKISRFVSAHRISWKIHYGEIPLGINVLHKCDTPMCVNPNHLFLGTQQDNLNDARKKKRHRWLYQYGEYNPRCKLTDKSILEIRSLFRISHLTPKDLADKFSISRNYVDKILKNQVRLKSVLIKGIPI